MTGHVRPTVRGYALPFFAALLSGLSLTLLYFGGRGLLFQARAASAGALAESAAGTVLYLPAGAHAAGANGANWRTDVEVHNPGSSTASFTVQLLKSGADNSSPASHSYTLAAGRSRRFVDVLVSEFGFDGAAALRVSVTSGTLVMTSRTYNLLGANPWKLPMGASFGLFEPGIAESDALSYGREGRLIQLTQQPSWSLDGFRTNVGIVNTTAISIDVHAEFYRSDGTYLGTKGGSDTNLPPYGFRQLNEVLGEWGTVADGYAIVRTTTAGGGLIAFATVIDNHNSGDPIFIPAAKVSGSSPTPTPTPTPTPPSGAKPNLYLYKPSGWANCLSANWETGCCTSTVCCSPFLSTYYTANLQMFVANNGPATLTGPVRFALSIDGVVSGYANWDNPSGVESGYGVVLDWPYTNPVAAGTHTLTVTVDPDNTIAETNEGDNTCTSSAMWTSVVFARAEEALAAPVGEDQVSVDDPLAVRQGPRLLPAEGRSALAAGTTEPIWVPASAHASGLNGSNWRTDMEVHNPGSTAVTYTIALLKQNTDNGGSVPTRTYTLGPQQSVRYVDILSTVFSTDGAAALRVTPQSGALLVNSRTYNLIGANSAGLPVGASFGQFVPGLAESQAIGPAEEGRVIQLTHRDSSTLADFRSNVGLVNTTASPIDLRLDLMRADGGLLATIQDDRTHLRPYESKQINGIFGEATSWLDDGYVIVRSATSAGRFFAFATVIDNHLTGDPIFVPAVKMARSALPPPTPTPTPPGPTPTPTPTPTPGGITVTINPGAVTLQPGGRQTFHVAVIGTTNTGVTWKVAEGTAGGTIDGQGSYTAPATSGIYNVVATSQADPTESGSAYVMVSTAVPDAEYAPKPTVTGTTTTETKSLTTTPNVKGTLTLTDGTKVEISPLPSALTVTLTRSTNTLDAVRAAGQETSGAMRTVTFTGDSASLDFVPTITIPAAEAGSLSALNVARVGPVAQGGQVQNDKVMFLPVARDASGNMVVRDIYLRGAARGAEASVAPPSAGRAALGVIKTLRSIWTASTYQGKINWAVEPQLVRMIPTSEAPRRKPLSTLPQSQQDEILRKPIQNVIVLAHGHNEAERYGYEAAEADAPWLMKYKQDVWTALYQEFQTNDATYADCTAFYEYIYPSYRPIFDGPGERLGAGLARLITEDPRLKKLTNKYNLFFVAHSMGGLVARSAINQLSFTVSPNFEKLVTWGTPHHGSPVVTMRYLLTSGYNLEVPNMCVTGSWLPLETFNQFSLYHGFAKDNAIDTPGERDLRWDNSKPLNLEGIGWKRAVWQVGDDVAFDPARNTDLYNSKLAEFNRTDKYALSDKYVALYGITDKIAPIDLANCSALATFAFSAPIAQGNGITHWLYNNPATVGSSYPGNPAVKESDGAVSVDSMVGLGVFSPFNTRSLGDTDHEQYYGDKGDSTASWTFDLLKLKTDPAKKCDCPTLVVDKVESAGSASNVSATLTWPGDTKPGQRVKGIASARGEGASRVVTPARSFTAPDNGKLTAVFDTSTLTSASPGEKIFLLGQIKDGSELSAPVTPIPSAPLFIQANISFYTPWGTYRDATGVESPGTVIIENDMTSVCRGAMAGLTFSCSWSRGGSTGQITVVLNSRYDTVLTFAFDEVVTSSNGTSTKSLTGGNVPWSSDESRNLEPSSNFELNGSGVCSHITKAVNSNTWAGGSSTLVSYPCTESSNLYISLVP